MGKHQQVGIIRGQFGCWPIQEANCEFIKGQDYFERPLRCLRGDVKETMLGIVLENDNRPRDLRKHPNLSVLQL